MPRVTVLPHAVAFESHPGETLLRAAIRHGVALPRGCRVGACLTCAARLVDGHVSMPPGTAMTEAQLADDLFLPCVAVARTDLVIEVGDGVGLLPPLPWTE